MLLMFSQIRHSGQAVLVLRPAPVGLDDTLLNGDSSHLWSRYLFDRGVVNEADYLHDEARFDREFHAGTIDSYAYLSFTLKPLRNRNHKELRDLQREFAQHHAAPAVAPQARKLIEPYRERGHTLIMATATNRFLSNHFPVCCKCTRCRPRIYRNWPAATPARGT